MKPEKARKLHLRAIYLTATFVAVLIIAGNASPPFQLSSVTDLPSTRGNPRDAALDDPIHIVGDAGWQAAKAAGNCTGAGTSADPYIISGKVIDAGGVTSGIWIENSTAHFRVQDCRVNGSAAGPAAGIRLVNVSNAVLAGNNCTNNAGPGIYLSKLCQKVDITANNASQNTLAYGIVIDDRCANVTIEGNEVSYNGDGIVFNVNCNDSLVRGNIIHGNPFEGVQLNVYCNNVTVEGNDIADNGNNGVQVLNSYYPVLRGNNCTGNGWHGIYLVGACPNATIEDNFATGNARHGIFVAGGSLNATVVGNNASGNTWSGIALDVGSNGSRVCNNSLGGNAGGNALDDSNFSRWDDGTRGNYWADYAGMDPDDDGMGDIPYAIPGLGGAIDHYPIWEDGDDVAPVITSTELTDNQLWGPAAPGFTLEITEAYAISAAWVSYDGGAHNWTCGETGTLPAWTSLANGSVTATFWANDTAGHVATGVTVTLRKDSLAPLLDVRQVLPFCDVACDSPTFDVNATDAQLDRTWYTLGNDPARYYFTGKIVTIDTAAWAALPVGEVTITFHANDTLGNEQVVTKIVTKQAAGGDLGLYLAIGGGIALAVVAGVIIVQKKRKKRELVPL